MYTLLYIRETKANRRERGTGRGKGNRQTEQTKERNEEGQTMERREQEGERGTGRRMPPTSSPVPPVPFLPSVPFFLLPSPSTPSPAAHPLTRSDGVRPSGRDVIATDRPATSNRRAALCHPARLALFLPAVPFRLPRSSRSFRSSFLSLFVLILSARSRLLPFPLPVPRSSLSPSYRLTAKPSPPPHHQPGRAIPSRSPLPTLSTLPGCLGIYADTSGGGEGVGQLPQGGGGRLCPN